MAFRREAIRGAVGGAALGAVDYRLLRRGLVSQVRKGRLARHEVCDAHPELIRAATNVGEQTSIRCPICDDDDLRLVTYAFGPRLPAGGRLVTTRAELAGVARRSPDAVCYVVEVCPDCRWNHLARTFPVPSSARGAGRVSGSSN